MLTDYKVNLPYPEVSGEITPNTMGLLLDDYSGRLSETTAIMQYAYQSYILKEKYPELSKLLEKISIVEMIHHEKLGGAIIAFQGDPIIAGRYAFFSGSYVNYVKNVLAIFQANIAAEKEAIECYQKLILSTNNQSLKDLVSRIIMDEEIHINLFEKVVCELRALN